MNPLLPKPRFDCLAIASLEFREHLAFIEIDQDAPGLDVSPAMQPGRQFFRTLAR